MTMAKLRVQLLSGFQVERDGIAITAFHAILVFPPPVE